MNTITLSHDALDRFSRLTQLRRRLLAAARTRANLQRMHRVDGWLDELVPPQTEPLQR